MDWAAATAHSLQLVRGVAASLACAGCFYLAGIALIPRRWAATLAGDEFPAILGAAVYVLVCWFGALYTIPLGRLSAGFAAGGFVLLLIRVRSLLPILTARLLRGSVSGWLLIFVGFYALAYVFTMPPATADFLPVAWTGNVDLLTYARYARYLQLLGPMKLSAFNYMNGIEYLQTPAVFSLLGTLALAFGGDPLRAAMAAQFALAALIGLFAARISRGVFGLSRWAAMAVGAILVSGPFFRYVAGNYFLSTLMATPVLLYLLWMTVLPRPARGADVAAMLRFGSAYVLLLFLYPFLLFAGIAAQFATIGLTLLAERGSTGPLPETRRPWVRQAAETARAVLVPAAVISIVLRDRVQWSVGALGNLSRVGYAGWPLDFISPQAVLGLPGTLIDNVSIHVGSPSMRPWAMAGFCAVALALTLLFFWRFRSRTTPAQRALAGLAAGSLVLYCAYFSVLGPSYQQWKFASYFASPLSFVIFAGGAHLVVASDPFRRAVGGRRLLLQLLLAAIPVVMVGGNVLVHAERDPVPGRFPVAISRLAALNDSPFQDLSIQMTDDPWHSSIWLAIYYLPTKRIHVVSNVFRPNEPLAIDRVSRQRPLFIQNYGCEGVGHTDVIAVEDLGCVLLAPPSLALATSYPFSQHFLFIEYEGLGDRRSEGRWSTGKSVKIEVSADLGRAWVHQNTYLNLRLDPQAGAESDRRLVTFSAAGHERGSVTLERAGWISLPLAADDWTGDRFRKASVAIDLSDGKVPADGEISTEHVPRPVLFQEISVTTTPLGPTPTPVRGRPASSRADAPRP